VGVSDRWAALQFDAAVTTLGVAIENASQEQVQVGPDNAPRWEKRYTMRQLLTPGFRLGGLLGADEGDDLPLGAVDGLIYDEVI